MVAWEGLVKFSFSATGSLFVFFSYDRVVSVTQFVSCYGIQICFSFVEFSPRKVQFISCSVCTFGLFRILRFSVYFKVDVFVFPTVNT